MFGKPKTPPRGDLFNERLQRVAARGVAQPPTSLTWTRHIGRALRQAVFRQGALILAHGEKFPVALKNLSETGARVEFFTLRQLPDIVVLVEPTLCINRPARIVWQRDGVAGLAFLSE